MEKYKKKFYSILIFVLLVVEFVLVKDYYEHPRIVSVKCPKGCNAMLLRVYGEEVPKDYIGPYYICVNGHPFIIKYRELFRLPAMEHDWPNNWSSCQKFHCLDD